MSTITKDLGVVTAYGYYKAGGGTMTESEFTQFMVDFGTASQTATEAAQAAAESAQASAAHSADAQDSAEEARQSASIASTRAIEADTAAGASIDAKNDAVTAQTAAETAQGKAEDAQAAAAQSASEAAESARTLTIDSVPTQGSTNAVQSGGVYDAIPAIDPTLTKSGQAADAKKTGDEIISLKEELNGDIDDLKSDISNYEKYILQNSELLNGVTWVENYSISANGDISANGNFHYADYISVEVGEYLLVYVGNGVNNNTRIHGYDANGNWVNQIEASASGTTTTPILVPFSVTPNIASIRISANKAVKLMLLAKKNANVSTDKLANEIKYALNTEADIKHGYDFSPSDVYESGYLYYTENAIGKTISQIQKTANSNVKSYKIDVSNYKKVFFPCIKSSTKQGELFENSNGIINAIYTNALLDSGTIVSVDLPEDTQYMYLTVNIGWSLSSLFLVGVISTIESGGGSGTVIVHDDSYPSLTSSEKNQIVSLCNDYFNKRTIFSYGGTRFRNQYIDNGCINNGKFLMNCGTFAQFIWMGRDADDFDINNYNSQITKAFDWGYYFDFAIHKAIYALAKASSGTDEQKYYGYQTPTGSEPYAFNAYTESGSMIWRAFMAAADIAEELYNMGCEVPRRAAEVGDLVFYRGPEYSGMTLETQLNFRNISHVGVIVDVDYQGSGRMRTTECTFWSDLGTIAHLSLSETDNSDKTRAGFYENRIAMIARHPHAFGIPTNVPNFITSI